MADVKGNVPLGYVWNRPKDTVSSTGAQICNVGNIMTIWFLVLWWETAFRQELDQISMVESVGSSGIDFTGLRKEGMKTENCRNRNGNAKRKYSF